MTEEPQTHQASRRIETSPHAIFAAFTDPAAWAEWLPPDGMTGRVDRWDLRPGGSYRMVLTYGAPGEEPNGKSGSGTDVVEGRFLAIEPDRRLVQSVTFESVDPAFAGAMRMTWSAEPRDGGALVSIVAEGVPQGISETDHVAAFNSTLDKLAAYLTSR